MPLVNTFNNLVKCTSEEENPTHMLNTSKINTLFFFMKTLPLLYGKMKNISLSQLDNNQELTELINIMYLCNVTFNKSDMSFHRGIPSYHVMFQNEKVNCFIE